MEYLILDGQSLTLEKLICAIRDDKKVMLSEAAETKVVQARQTIENAIQSKQVIYGINTGFGALSEVVISKAETKQLQKNILMSHAAGVKCTIKVYIRSCLKKVPSAQAATLLLLPTWRLY
jgi:histidine ammonia-lyase